MTLTKPLSKQIDFVGLHLPICTPFPLENLFTPYGFYPFKWINKCPYTVDFYGLYFGFHGLKPFLRVRPLQCIHIGDWILIILIELERITVTDQETKVSVRLM